MSWLLLFLLWLTQIQGIWVSSRSLLQNASSKCQSTKWQWVTHDWVNALQNNIFFLVWSPGSLFFLEQALSLVSGPERTLHYRMHGELPDTKKQENKGFLKSPNLLKVPPLQNARTTLQATKWQLATQERTKTQDPKDLQYVSFWSGPVFLGSFDLSPQSCSTTKC